MLEKFFKTTENKEFFYFFAKHWLCIDTINLCTVRADNCISNVSIEDMLLIDYE